MATLPQEPASPPGAFAIHRKRRSDPQPEDADRKEAPRGSGPLLVQSSPVRRGVDGAILSRKEKPLRSGADTTRHFRGHPPRARSLPSGGRGGPGAPARTRGCGDTGPRTWAGCGPGARAPPAGGARTSAGRSPPVLTLAAEPEAVRADGLQAPLVALRLLPLPSTLRRRREPVPAACVVLPRARLARPVSPASRVRAPARPAQARGPPEKRLVRRRGQREPSGQRPSGGERARPGRPGQVWRREHGRQTADPDGQREAQQEHHPARQRRQDLEKCSRREGVCRTLVIGSLHFCCVWFCNFPDYSKYQDGHVK